MSKTFEEAFDELSAVALLSDGASRLADRFDLMTWPDVLGVLSKDGPGERSTVILIRLFAAAYGSLGTSGTVSAKPMIRLICAG